MEAESPEAAARVFAGWRKRHQKLLPDVGKTEARRGLEADSRK